MTKQVYLYRDKPLFGLDIGHNSLRVMQSRLISGGRQPQVIGYGTVPFDAGALADNGVIEKPELLVAAYKRLLDKELSGKLTTSRVALAIPAHRTYSRSMQLPRLDGSELAEAVRLEAEQYISVPLQDLYLDYSVTSTAAETCELYMVAVPRTIVDSYTAFAAAVGLEPVVVETSMSAESRLFGLSDQSGVTTALVDFGSLTASISIIDKTTLITGTVPVGGRMFTDAIQRKFDITHEKANFIKVKYGLNASKWQKDILAVIEPALQQVVTEIRRTIRYHEDRYGTGHTIGQIVMLGGGSNMPGLGEYLTNVLGVPVRVRDPWTYLDRADLRQPNSAHRPSYATAAGLSLIDPKAVFAV